MPQKKQSSGSAVLTASIRLVAFCRATIFLATPFAPSGKKNDEEALFGWIVSDVGLNDGIKSELVKTPHVVVRDDGTPDAVTHRSRLYHIYVDDTVREDINRSANPEESRCLTCSHRCTIFWAKTGSKPTGNSRRRV